jgi:hypothetical protein
VNYYAAIEERESEDDRKVPRRVSLRAISILQGGSRVYLACIESKPDLRLVPGDTAQVCFDLQANERSFDWKFTAEEPFPFAAPQDICGVLTRPFDRDKLEWVDIELPSSSVVQLREQVDTESLRKRVLEMPAVQCDVHLDVSQKAIQRQINTVSTLCKAV